MSVRASSDPEMDGVPHAATVGDARPRLLVSQVSKSFSGLFVLHDVSIECAKGEIIGLIGPNGAGKSTLLNAISSLLRIDAGEISVGEVAIANTTPQSCALHGIGRTFQNIKLFARLSVEQNVRVSLTTCLRHRPARANEIHIDRILAEFDLGDLRHRKAGTLSYGDQRRLEIARALALGPDFLLLDEPAAGMNVAETTQLVGSIERIRDQFDCGVIVIDHDLRFIMTVCERIYVLDMGRIVAAGRPEDVRNDPKVIEVYIGTRRSARAVPTEDCDKVSDA